MVEVDESLVRTVIDKLGGATVAARVLDVSGPNVILNWRKRGQVPADKVLEIERLTGISRHELRADIFGVSA
jgi:DNA-binding transcriptional regulator YdaS (Cro superfamily)